MNFRIQKAVQYCFIRHPLNISIDAFECMDSLEVADYDSLHVKYVYTLHSHLETQIYDSRIDIVLPY